VLSSFPAITDRRIRIALVGCGRISERHIRAICQQHESAELVSICDIQSDRLEQAQLWITECAADYPSAATNPALFNDFNELLAASQNRTTPADLVVLCTPSGLHSQQSIASAAAGLHVCTEKPMATHWEDAQKMVKACNSESLHLFVVMQNRLNNTLQLVKRQLQAGRFGRLAMVTVNVFWQRPQDYYDQASWRGTLEFDGGALMNQACHYVDLLDWLIGPVKSINACIATLVRSIEAEDTATLQLRWRSGALGTMAVTMLAYPKNLEGSITILGESGTVRIGGSSLNRIEHWSFADTSSDDTEVAQINSSAIPQDVAFYCRFYNHILEVLQSKTQSLFDGRDALRTMELLTGAYRSAKHGRTINLPLEN